MLAALDAKTIAVLQPSVTASLGASSPAAPWVAQAHLIAQLACGPLVANLADACGRLLVLQLGLAVFAIGSLVNALAPGWSCSLVGRVLEGIGAAVMVTIPSIIINDLVPLAERGAWNGIILGAWIGASIIGQPIAGVLAEGDADRWRWYWRAQLPAAAVCSLGCAFVRLKTPKTNWRHRLAIIDWRCVARSDPS